MSWLWKAELLGKLRLSGERGEVEHFRTQRTGWLLAQLAYHVGEPLSREFLAECIWPEGDPVDARRKLTVALSSLRSQVEPSDVPHNSVLIATRETIRLRAETVTSDVAQYHAQLKAAEQARDDQERIACLRTAVDLYGGGLLPGCYIDWVTFEGQRLEALYLGSVLQLVALLETQSQLVLALDYAIRAAKVDPLGQKTRHTVARLYLAAGRPHRALTECETIARMLREELGAEVTPELQILTRELRQQAAQHNGSRGDRQPPGVALPAIPQPAPDGAAPAPEGSPLKGRIDGVLDLASPYYLERSADAQMREALDSGCGLIRLKGFPQSGKSSLLVRAADHARRRGGQVAWSDLEPLNLADLESRELCRTLAAGLWRQYRPAITLADCWDAHCPDAMNLTECVEQLLNLDPQRTLLWVFDHVDRLLTSPWRRELCALLRAWGSRRSYDPEGVWNRLTLILSYSSEAVFSPYDDGASPMNIGMKLWLDDFDLEATAELNRRHGGPLKAAADVKRFHGWTGGHACLLHTGLSALAERNETLAEFEERGVWDKEPYGDHLRRLRYLLRQHQLEVPLHELLRGRRPQDPDALFRLREWGIVAGEGKRDFRLRCGLYERYFRGQLAGEE